MFCTLNILRHFRVFLFNLFYRKISFCANHCSVRIVLYFYYLVFNSVTFDFCLVLQILFVLTMCRFNFPYSYFMFDYIVFVTCHYHTVF